LFFHLRSGRKVLSVASLGESGGAERIEFGLFTLFLGIIVFNSNNYRIFAAVTLKKQQYGSINFTV
jgi:hypothetical protein